MGFLTGALGSAIGAIGGLIGSGMDARNDEKLARMNADFQREVYQNQYQWKAADAKKAGLHPLAVIGGGSYSASPISSGGSTSYAKSLGKLGESIGDAAAAYMSKDEIAKQAAEEKAKADKRDEAQGRLLDAQTEYYSALALEASRRALGYTKPMADGSETIKGQTDAKSPYMETMNKYAWPVYPDGSHGDPVPSSEISEAYENAPGHFAYTPYIDAMVDKWHSIITGKPIDGRYHDWRTNRWTRKRPPKHPLFGW